MEWKIEEVNEFGFPYSWITGYINDKNGTVEKIGYRKYLWWVHSKYTCLSYGEETTEQKAKRAAEKVMS